MKLPLAPPNIEKYLEKIVQNPDKLLTLYTQFEPTDHKNRYLHWDELRHREPPDGFTIEEVWVGTKLARMQLRKELPFVDGDKRPFTFATPDPILKMLYDIDQSQPATDTNSHNALIEEAISSSQLEGAATTRKIAKEMIRQQRPPKDHSEQMILNNYHAMLFVQAHKNEQLTPSIILELHRIVTDKTLGDSDTAGQCRTAADDVQVIDREGNILHTPPPAAELPQRLKTLCDFANEHGSAPFIHPIIRAILLHFMLAYDHPFVDGNGRTARALFYWVMARKSDAAQKKYELMGLLSISGAIKTAPIQYARAFLYTETDENDTTYFIIHQLHTIQAAIEQWHTALARKREELGSAVGLLAGTRLDGILNGRQHQLLQHALNNPGAIYRIKAHQSVHGVTYQTARTDLLAMSDEWGLLHRVKEGKMFIFLSPPDLRQRLEAV